MNERTVRKLLGDERDRLDRLLRGLASEAGDEWSGGEVSGTDQHPADIGTERFERDKDMSIRSGLEVELAEVVHAMRRLDEGGYGVCEACGRTIAVDRLRARPATRFCVEDQARAERDLRTA